MPTRIYLTAANRKPFILPALVSAPSNLSDSGRTGRFGKSKQWKCSHPLVVGHPEFTKPPPLDSIFYVKSSFINLSCQKLNLNKLAKNEKLIYHHGPFFTIQEVSVWTKSTCRTQLSDFVAQWREGISSQKYFGSRINSLWECLVFLCWFPWVCFQRDERGMYNDFFSLFIIFLKELYFPDFLTVSCPSSSTTYIIQIDRNL